jgi:hypothetical protein
MSPASRRVNLRLMRLQPVEEVTFTHQATNARHLSAAASSAHSPIAARESTPLARLVFPRPLPFPTHVSNEPTPSPRAGRWNACETFPGEPHSGPLQQRRGPDSNRCFLRSEPSAGIVQD